MSMNIDGTDLNLNRMGIQKVDKSTFNLSFGKREAEVNGEAITVTNYVGLSISKTGALKSENSKAETSEDKDETVEATDTVKLKKGGVSSKREPWEDMDIDGKKYGDFVKDPGDELETMRLLEPETYKKCMDLFNKMKDIMNTPKEVHKGFTVSYNGIEDMPEDMRKKYIKLDEECFKLQRDFRNKYYYDEDENWIEDPAKNIHDAWSKLEDKYSDSVHDIGVNFYNDDTDDKKASMWRNHTKFNILLTNDQMVKLGVGNKLEKDSILKLIEESMERLKEIDKAYEGNKTYLRFGAKLDNNGFVTYHANYYGCENSEGISSDTTEGLLKKLMEDE